MNEVNLEIEVRSLHAFAKAMKLLEASNDPETAHIYADEIMIETLLSLVQDQEQTDWQCKVKRIVKSYVYVPKWYA